MSATVLLRRLVLLSLVVPAIAIALSGCSHSKPESPWRIVGRNLSGLLKEPFSDSRPIEVIYATNRDILKDGAGCSDQSFGINATPAVSYGICSVHAPKSRRVGGIDPAERDDTEGRRGFRALSHLALDETTFRAGIQGADPVLVFVHGFNVRFEEALYRAAQIAYDLKFQGKVVLFSWPAGARQGLIDSTLINRTYETNRRNAAATVPSAVTFFRMLAASGARVHVLVHSMGHQVVLPSLVSAAAVDDSGAPFIQELILNAPDYGVDEFLRIAPQLKKAASRITLYCSPNDTAITASRSYNGDRRLGGCESYPDIEALDVINVSEIDSVALGGGLGHSYYASRPILTDVFQVMMGIEADKRLFIRRSEPGRVENFFLRP